MEKAGFVTKLGHMFNVAAANDNKLDIKDMPWLDEHYGNDKAQEKMVAALTEEGIDDEAAKLISHNLDRELQTHITEQRQNNPHYRPTQQEIQQFIQAKLEDGSLARVEIASVATDIYNNLGVDLAMKAVAAISKCGASKLCLGSLTAASLGYAGYVLYKHNIHNTDHDHHTDAVEKNQDSENTVKSGKPADTGSPHVDPGQGGDTGGDGPKWKKWFNKADQDFDPKTCQYKESSAHSSGIKGKSPVPTEGPKHLPGSYRFSESGRVAVDVENNEIIIFRRSGAGANEYHGYVIKPETLVSRERDAYSLLFKLDKIDKKGEINKLLRKGL